MTRSFVVSGIVLFLLGACGRTPLHDVSLRVVPGQGAVLSSPRSLWQVTSIKVSRGEKVINHPLDVEYTLDLRDPGGKPAILRVSYTCFRVCATQVSVAPVSFQRGSDAWAFLLNGAIRDPGVSLSAVGNVIELLKNVVPVHGGPRPISASGMAGV